MLIQNRKAVVKEDYGVMQQQDKRKDVAVDIKT